MTSTRYETLKRRSAEWSERVNSSIRELEKIAQCMRQERADPSRAWRKCPICGAPGWCSHRP